MYHISLRISTVSNIYIRLVRCSQKLNVIFAKSKQRRMQIYIQYGVAISMLTLKKVKLAK